MSMWRPAQEIRVKALGLHWRNGCLLAAEVTNDNGEIKGVRPLGGSVEFGETAEDALRREFQEELGIDVIVNGAPIFYENIYEHEGQIGHELLVIYEVIFPVGAYANETRLTFQEDNGVICQAEWFSLDQLDAPTGPELFPTGLKSVLKRK